MPIQYVGGQLQSITGSVATNTTITFSLTGGLASTPATDDIVIVTYGTGSTSDKSIGVLTSGYTEIAELYGNDTVDVNLSVSWKRMGGTADTTVQVGPTAGSADNGYVLIQVYRGVDTTTALDVASTTATAANSGTPNPPAITPTTAGAVIVAIGGTGSSGGVTYTASYLTNFITASNTVAGNDITVGMGWVDWTSGSYDPAAFTVTGSANTQAWAAVTMALRPLPTFVDGAAVISPTTTTTASGIFVIEGAAQISPVASLTADLVQVYPSGSYGAGNYGVGPYSSSFIDGSATITPTTTTTVSGVRVAQDSSTITPAVTTTVAGVRVAQGSSAISPALSVVVAAQRVAQGSSTISPVLSVTVAAQRVAQGSSTISPVLTVVVSGQRIAVGASAISAVLTTTAAANRVTSGSSAITAALSTAVSGQRIAAGASSIFADLLLTSGSALVFNSAVQINATLTLSATLTALIQASAATTISCIVSGNGRLIWEPESPDIEPWTQETATVGAWTPVSSVSDSWAAQSATTGLWTEVLPDSEPWVAQ